MRIDKYLKVARVLKRRAVAKELGDNNRLMINGKIAKASSEVKVGDVVDILFGHRHLKIEILEVKAVYKKDDDLMYRILES